MIDDYTTFLKKEMFCLRIDFGSKRHMKYDIPQIYDAIFVDSPEIISINVLMKGIANRHIVIMSKPKPRNIKRLLDESIQDDPKVVPVKA